MLQVVKRNGDLAEFHLQKISNAIQKAFDATEKVYTDDVIQLLALRVTADFQSRIVNDRIDVESIQDSAERILAACGYEDVAKAYILYRKQREKLRNMENTVLNYRDAVNSYVKVEDWRIREEDQNHFSIGGLILNNSGAVTENYWLSEIYDDEIVHAHRTGEVYLHGLSMLTGRLAGWSLREIIEEGLGGIPGRTSCGPAKHLPSLISQLVMFFGIMQNEWSGSQTLVSFDTYLAPYVKKDQMSYRDVFQCMEALVFGLNIPTGLGIRAPFSTIGLDWTVPEDLMDRPAIVGGRQMDFTYGECQEEMDLINQAFLSVMTAGDSEGRRFTWPIPVYAVTKDFDWGDSRKNQLLFESAAKYGIPYFANFVSGSRKPADGRLISTSRRLEPSELYPRSGGPFGAGEHTGSIGLVTINLPRLAFLSSGEREFYRKLDRTLDLAARAQKIRRGVLTRLLNEGLYPYTKRYMGSFEQCFSSIGIIGMNEACLNARWLRRSLAHPQSVRFASEVLRYIRNRLVDFQQKYGDLYELEATLDHSCAMLLAQKDREYYPDIVTAGKTGDTPYYSCNSLLPLDAGLDLYESLDNQDQLQALYTGGMVYQIYRKERVRDWRIAANMVRTITNDYRIPYFAFSPTYSVCPEHGYLEGEVYECPICRRVTEVVSRFPSYMRPADEEETAFESSHAIDEPQNSLRFDADRPEPKEAEPEEAGPAESADGSAAAEEAAGSAGAESGEKPAAGEEPGKGQKFGKQWSPEAFGVSPTIWNVDEVEDFSEDNGRDPGAGKAAGGAEAAGAGSDTKSEENYVKEQIEALFARDRARKPAESRHDGEAAGRPGARAEEARPVTAQPASETGRKTVTDPEREDKAKAAAPAGDDRQEAAPAARPAEKKPEAEARPAAETRQAAERPARDSQYRPSSSRQSYDRRPKPARPAAEEQQKAAAEAAPAADQARSEAKKKPSRDHSFTMPADGKLSDGWYLFVVRTDPNSMVGRQILDGYDCKYIDAVKMRDLTRSYRIMQAPTLLCLEEGVPQMYVGLTAIRRFLNIE